MFPLATPATSGLWVDWLTIAMVLVPVCAFALGASDLWCRLRRPQSPAIDIVTLFAYAALGLVGLAVVVMLAGARGIPVAQVAFLAVAVRGLIVAARRAPRAWLWLKVASGNDLLRAAAFAGAALWSVWFWTGVFRDHVALPVMYDGIAHTAYYLKIVEAGAPTLGRVPIGWPSLFGTQLFDFYPTGTHSLVAITSGYWGQWGVISHAGVLKAWFTLAVAAMPWVLVLFARRLMPAMPWWLGLALVFVATPGFRFPLEAAHEGGASRLLAHVLMTPIYADVLAGRFSRWRSHVAAGIALGLAFLMHPSTFVALSALLVYAAVFGASADPDWRPRVSTLGGAVTAVLIGGIAAETLLKWNGGAAAARDAVKAFSSTAMVSRVANGWPTLFAAEYGMGPIKELLVLAGFVALVVGRNALGLSWRVVALPVVMLLLGVLVLSAQLVSLPGFRLLGGAFYDETPRVVELMYEPVGLCLIALGWAAWRFASGRPLAQQEAMSSYASRASTSTRTAGVGVSVFAAAPARRATATAVAVALTAGALTYGQASTSWVRDHVTHWDAIYSTARISRLQALGRWIEQNTEPHAVLFYPPFDTEIWEAWTGRRGIFMYGECHVHNGQLPCNSRKTVINHRVEVLRDALVEPTPDTRCLAQIDRFERPAYFVVAEPFASTQSFRMCSDATYVATLDGHAVITYRKP